VSKSEFTVGGDDDYVDYHEIKGVEMSYPCVRQIIACFSEQGHLHIDVRDASFDVEQWDGSSAGLIGEVDIPAPIAQRLRPLLFSEPGATS